jgi:hypothetical protein
MNTYAAAPGVMAEQVDGRTLLIDAASTELITLNQVGSLVWRALGSERVSVDQLVDAVTSTFVDAPVDRVRADVQAFLDQLVEDGLVDAA